VEINKPEVIPKLNSLAICIITRWRDVSLSLVNVLQYAKTGGAVTVRLNAQQRGE
jgi:hypothetical protein